MDYKQAFQKAYLQQQGEKFTKKNVEYYGLDPDLLVLLEETDKYWLIKTRSDGQSSDVINVVYKYYIHSSPWMESLELSSEPR